MKKATKRFMSLAVVFAMVLSLMPPLVPTVSANPPPVPAPPSGVNYFTQTIAPPMRGVQFEEQFRMIRVDGGTFTLGCERNHGTGSCAPANGCPLQAVAVSGVSVDSYYISQTEVTRNLWNAVMGNARLSTTGTGFMAGQGNHAQSNITWYQVHDFLARLYVLTGLEWRLPTEAEWEFAAKGGNAGIGDRFTFAGSNTESAVVTASGGMGGGGLVGQAQPNRLGLYDMSGNVEEWTWNTWSNTHAGGNNPTGPGGHLHNQKARRGGSGTAGNGDIAQRHIAARQIRSIDGADGMLGFRIALSADRTTVPAGMLRARDVQRPKMDDRAIPNSWRDPRWVTGDDYVWTTGTGGWSANIKLWETGEITINGSIGGMGGSTVTGQTVGQWYTINNMGLVVVTGSGRGQLSYIFMDYDVMATVSDGGITALPRGRMEKVRDTRDARVQARPTIANMTPPAQMAADNPRNHTQIDLSLLALPPEQFPQNLRQQDARLLDGATAAERANQGWWMGFGMGGVHTYRKDVDPEEFRFVVYSPVFGTTLLAAGQWYTVSDTFLRIIHPGGYVTEYLYTVSSGSNPSFSHVSFQGYERGDSRSFTIHPNANITGHTHEIPRDQAASALVYRNRDDGQSTFMKPPITGADCAGCNRPIPDCNCPTICPACSRHVNNCNCDGIPPTTTPAPPVTTAAVQTGTTAVNTGVQPPGTTTVGGGVQPPGTTTVGGGVQPPGTTTVGGGVQPPGTTTVGGGVQPPGTTTVGGGVQPPGTTTVGGGVQPPGTTTVGGGVQPPMTTTAGSINTAPVSTNPDETATPPPATTSENEEPFLYGDVDGNGAVTILDALEILMYLAGLESILDEGGDHIRAAIIALPADRETPNISDALEILMHLAGMVSRLDELNIA